MPSRTYCRPLRSARNQRGFTLAEVMISLIVFTMMTLMFAAVFPIAVRGAQFSNNYAQASLLAQHKIDQLRAAGVGKIDYTDLYNLGVIDSMANPPASLPYSFTFTTADALVSNGTTQGYFPPGSAGTLTIVDYHTINSSVPANQVDYVTVAVTWSGGGVSSGSYSVPAIIIQMPHR